MEKDNLHDCRERVEERKGWKRSGIRRLGVLLAALAGGVWRSFKPRSVGLLSPERVANSVILCDRVVRSASLSYRSTDAQHRLGQFVQPLSRGQRSASSLALER